ncbi:MAG: DUF2157 domain-containing protein [Acidobacteria bacterium]|nr:MAG: DUF2157 domain-containing protein [Acidobacteriota bacterium]
MSARHARWLLGELDALVEQGLLTAEAAERLRRHYAARAEAGGLRLRQVFLAVLGTLLIGGGVILLLAHNWSELSRATRTVLSFLPLVAAQGVAGWVLASGRRAPAWREGAALALSLAVAAAIALIGQTYHIPGSLQGFLLTWMLLSLPLIYLFDSTAVAVLYLAVIAWWAALTPWRHEPPAGYLLLLAAVLPWLWPHLGKRRADGRALLLGWTLALSVAVAFDPLLARQERGVWIPAFALLFAYFALEGKALYGPGRPWRKAPLYAAGSLGVVGHAFVLSYRDCWRDLADPKVSDPTPGVIAVWVALAALAGRTLVLWWRAVLRRDVTSGLLGAFAPLALAAYALALAAAPPRLILALLCSAYLLALGLGLMGSGLRSGDGARANAGLGIVALLIVLRFFDSDLSLVARGIAFLVVGVGFLVANYRLSRLAAGGGATEVS